jgi:hypothetical protein
MSSRPPLSEQERAQIRALLRFLIIVLLAVAIASASVGVIITVFKPGAPADTATATP